MGFLDRMVSDLISKSTGVNAKPLVRKLGAKNLLMMGGAALAGAAASGKLAGQGGAANVPPALGGSPQPPMPPAHAAPPVHASPPNYTAPPQTHAAPPQTHAALPHTYTAPPPAHAAPPQTHAAPPPPPVAPPGATASPPPLPGQPQPAPAAAAPPPPPLPSSPGNVVPPLPTSTGPVAVNEAPEEAELPPELTYAAVRTLVAAALADGNLAESEREVIHRHLANSPLSDEQTAQVRRDLVLPARPEELARMVIEIEQRELLFRLGALLTLADEEVADSERQWLGQLARAFAISASRQQELEDEVFAA